MSRSLRRWSRHLILAGAGVTATLAASAALGLMPAAHATHTGTYPPHGFSDVPLWVSDAVDWVAHDPDGAGPLPPTMSGYPDGTFRPAEPLSRAEALRALHRVVGSPASYPDHGFSDVPAWIDGAVRWAAGTGIVTGFSDATFRPGSPVTRGQQVNWLHRAAGAPGPPPSCTSTLSDITAWTRAAVDWADCQGIVNGYPDGTFRPDRWISRAEATQQLATTAHTPAAWSTNHAPPTIERLVVDAEARALDVQWSPLPPTTPELDILVDDQGDLVERDDRLVTHTSDGTNRETIANPAWQPGGDYSLATRTAVFGPGPTRPRGPISDLTSFSLQPAVPVVTVTGGPGSLHIEWEPVAGFAALGYEVFLAPAATPVESCPAATTAAGVTEFVVTELPGACGGGPLVGGETYTAAVGAVVADGPPLIATAPTAESYVAPQPPAAPIVDWVAVTGTSAEIAWTIEPDPNVETITATWRLLGGDWQAGESTTDPGAGHLAVTGLPAGQPVEVAVVATGPTGASDPTDALRHVLPVAPPSVTLVDQGAGDADVEWTWTPPADPAWFRRFEVTVTDTASGNVIRSIPVPDIVTRTTPLRDLPASAGLTASVAAVLAEPGTAGVTHSTVAGATTPQAVSGGGSLPAQCRASPETHCVDHPHAFVQTANDPAATPGAPDTLSGINLKRGPYWTGTELYTWGWQFDRYFGGNPEPGAPVFDHVRVPIDWPYFQTAPGAAGFEEDAFAALDAIVDNAVAAGVPVILDPLHLSRPSANQCTQHPRMNGALWRIPAWAWVEPDGGDLPAAPAADCSDQETDPLYQDRVDDILANLATPYLRAVAARYSDHSTPIRAARSRQVVAIDLVNEPRSSPAATGATDAARRMNNLLGIYATWIAPTGADSVRAVAPTKILLLESLHGDIDLTGVDLTAVSGASHPNVAWSLHDYFGGDTASRYGGSGYATQGESLYQGDGSPPGEWLYDTTAADVPTRVANQRAHIDTALAVLTAHDLPLHIGEYGIVQPCRTEPNDAEGPALADATSYVNAVTGLYDTIDVGGEVVALSRTWWATDDPLDVRDWYGCHPGKWVPYADDLAPGS